MAQPHRHAHPRRREPPDEFQLVGAYEPDPAIREAKLGDWAADIPDIPVFESIDQALDSDAEAIICEGRVSENLDYAERALGAGKHVLLEKPAGVDMAQLERLHATARRKGLHLQMAYMWRYNPAIAEMIRHAGRARWATPSTTGDISPSPWPSMPGWWRNSTGTRDPCTSRWPATWSTSW